MWPRFSKLQFPKCLNFIVFHENYQLICKLCNQGLQNYNTQNVWISLVCMKIINFFVNWAAKACNLVQLKLEKLQFLKCLNLNSPPIYKITRWQIQKMKYEPCPMPWCSHMKWQNSNAFNDQHFKIPCLWPEDGFQNHFLHCNVLTSSKITNLWGPFLYCNVFIDSNITNKLVARSIPILLTRTNSKTKRIGHKAIP